MKLFSLIPIFFYIAFAGCAENKGKIGGAFAGTTPPPSENSDELRVYVRRNHINDIENLRPRTNTSKDPSCRDFRDPLDLNQYQLLGMRYSQSMFFIEVLGLRDRIQRSQTNVARLDLNSKFEFVNSTYKNRENPTNEPLVADLNESRLVINVRGVQPNFPPELRFSARIYDSMSIRKFRFLNEELTEHCR